MNSLTPSKKAQLHEVADFMLEIYRTLVRMRYLDPAWIEEGPHDIDALLPVYRSSNLDDSIIYLYSILPYINTAGAAQVDFLQGGEFADFRDEESIKRGRDPFYEDDEDNQLPPYMTPLSLLGNHRSVILYNSRKHWIAIQDQESEVSTDHGVYEDFGLIESGGEGDGDAIENEETDEDLEEIMDEECSDEGGSIHEDYEEEDDDTDDSDGSWDLITSRPAPNVLRDIVRWYRELIETPGGGDQSGGEWDSKLLKPLYRRHGWPDALFDGDAFLIDHARANAAAMAEWHINSKHRVVWLEHQVRQGESGDSSVNTDLREAMVKADTAEELWVARWKLWREECKTRSLSGELRRTKEKRDLDRKDLPLMELRILGERLHSEKAGLEKIRQEVREVEAGMRDDDPGCLMRLHYSEKRLDTFQKAYDAAQADVDVLFPGGPAAPDPKAGYRSRLRELTAGIEDLQQNIKGTHGWVSQLPEGTDKARMLAQDYISEKERSLEHHEELRRGVLASLGDY